MERTSRGVDGGGGPPSFPLYPFPVSCCRSALFHSVSSLFLFSSPSQIQLGGTEKHHECPVKKRQTVAEVGGDQTDWSSRSPELEWTRRAGRTTEHKTVIECAPRRKTHSTTGSAVLLLSMLCIGYSDLSSCSLSVLDYNQKSNQKR